MLIQIATKISLKISSKSVHKFSSYFAMLPNHNIHFGDVILLQTNINLELIVGFNEVNLFQNMILKQFKGDNTRVRGLGGGLVGILEDMGVSDCWNGTFRQARTRLNFTFHFDVLTIKGRHSSMIVTYSANFGSPDSISRVMPVIS